MTFLDDLLSPLLPAKPEQNAKPLVSYARPTETPPPPPPEAPTYGSQIGAAPPQAFPGVPFESRLDIVGASGWQTLINFTGKAGRIITLQLAVNAGAPTLNFRFTIDGVVYNMTGINPATCLWLVAVSPGGYSTSTNTAIPQPCYITWSQSIKIEAQVAQAAGNNAAVIALGQST